MQRLELVRRFDDVFYLRATHSSLCCCQPFRFDGGDALPFFGVGDQMYCRAMRVIEQVFFDQFLEVAAFGDGFFDGIQRRFEGQRLDGIAVIQPGG